MPFEKGREKTGGRVKGVKNKITAEIEEAQYKIVHAVNSLDVQVILQQLAAENPKALVALMAKVLPNKLEMTGGEDENGVKPITIQIRGYKPEE